MIDASISQLVIAIVVIVFGGMVVDALIDLRRERSRKAVQA